MAAGDITVAQDGDISVAQDGGQGAKLHPYLVTLVRWCVSCIWTTATVLLHRLMTAPLPSITASKPPSSSKRRSSTKPRPASKDHLHPEPRVECVVLQQPATPTLDVIFVHGLYGSLGNTWRQGDWKPRYKTEPNKVSLRNHETNICKCTNKDKNIINEKLYEFQTNINELTLNNINNSLLKILPNENALITEQFYNNTLLDQIEIVDNYETQASFVRDLFEKDNKNCDNDNECKCEVEINVNECKCRINGRECDVGCGCVCDDCYSPCWPKDWIQVDFPGARVISINYTSDPYLWRPLWVKENKRLRLHERADQMMEQLLDLGVGDRPIVWVGHSKGGLFIKQIYCDAFEAYLEMSRDKTKEPMPIDNKSNEDNIVNNNTSSVCIENEINDQLRDVNDLLVDDGVSSKIKEDFTLKTKSSLWRNSVGFMFYSVPHRGSPLADIKTPITARSIDLLEISKDCSLVLSLQSRWLTATESSIHRPLVRSLVETCRTLMSVLWLRIVSVDSADAGIGSLCGVSVDHRDICKPSSRHCLLYTELTDLIHAALNKCNCQ